ncbi:hypothetical protein ACSQ76_16385 [Roseovarius sp. B08]|uniref:hypothetical protein n=1 Tax=Roseovarius sp. B08 TaxID=3449223 RepID=UPI003EDBE74E
MSVRTWLRWLGAGLVVLSFCLLLRELMLFGPEALQIAAEPGQLALALGASLGYAVLLTLPAAAWSCVLREGDDAAFVSRTAVIIYARCNVLKYLPGNVFHFGGRQLMARRAGWSHRIALVATAVEIVALPLAAGGVALIALALSGPYGSGDLSRDLFGALGTVELTPAAAALGLILAGFAAAVIVAVARRLGVAATSLTAMAALEIAFFAASAALVAGMAAAMNATGPADLPVIAAAYLVGWIAGFLVPGAPGGIGVREAVFLYLVAATVAAPTALALALLTRLVTTLGDLWFSLLANASDLPGTAIRNGG